MGGNDGIDARHYGSGDLTIKSTNGGAASVTGDNRGIYATNYNSGNLTVTADNVTGTDGDGIYANNDVTADDNTSELSITSYGSVVGGEDGIEARNRGCLLYTSPSPRDRQKSRMPSSA